MSCEFQKDIKFDEIEVGNLVLVELFGEDNWTFLGDRRGTAMRRIGDTWYFKDMQPLYKEAIGYRLFRVTVMDAEWEWKNLESVIGKARYSESTDAHLLVAEIDRLRGIETRVQRLADAYASNTVMLAEIADAPDSLIGIMAECSFSASKMIRKALDGE